MQFEDARRQFRQRVIDTWIVDFCDARASDFRPDGFDRSTLDRISGFDAYWFQQAVDRALVSTSNGFFLFPQSGAKEQIFSSGLKGQEVRKTYLWVEPVITIGACARLILQYGWPLELIGAQSEAPYAFDFVGKSQAGGYGLVGEVKSTAQGVERLLDLMGAFCASLAVDVSNLAQNEKNAFRKVEALWKLRPEKFWALGPEDHGRVFDVSYNDESGTIELRPADTDTLRFT